MISDPLQRGAIANGMPICAPALPSVRTPIPLPVLFSGRGRTAMAGSRLLLCLAARKVLC